MASPAENRACRRTQRLAPLALVLSACLWSLNGPLIKLLRQPEGDQVSGASAAAIACYRSLFGGAFFLPLALRRVSSLRQVRPIWPIASVVTFTFMTTCFVIATTLTAAANAIVLQYLAPLVVFALSPLMLGIRPRWSEGGVLLLSLAGAAILFAGGPAGSAAPLAIGLCSGLSYGLLIVILGGLKRVDPIVVVAMNFVGSGVLMAVLATVLPDASLRLTLRQFGLLVLMSVVQFSVPYVIFSWALRHVEAHRASLISTLEAILNPIWTYLAVGEAPPVATLVGGPLILLSVIGWVWLTWRHEDESLAATLPTSSH